MHVVRERVAVEELERLADLHGADARREHTALLIDDDRLGGRREHAIAEPFLHVHERVLHLAVTHQHVVGDDRAAVLRGTILGAGELHRGRRWRRSLKPDLAHDAADGREIERGRRPLLALSLLATDRGGEQQTHTPDHCHSTSVHRSLHVHAG